MGFLAILIQIAVGVIAGFYFVKVIKKPIFGQLWGAIIVGVIGGVLFGFFSKNITKILVENPLAVDFIGTFFGAFLLIWVFSKIAHQ